VHLVCDAADDFLDAVRGKGGAMDGIPAELILDPTRQMFPRRRQRSSRR